MSRANPEPAVDALVGRVYEFKGRKIRNSNMALIALTKCGVPLEQFQARVFEAVPIAIYAMTHDVAEVLDLLASSEKDFRKEALRAFAEEFSEEESAEATGIVCDCIGRFSRSLTQYRSRHGNAGNRQAAADIS